jgi:hypothetical protein
MNADVWKSALVLPERPSAVEAGQGFSFTHNFTPWNNIPSPLTQVGHFS